MALNILVVGNSQAIRTILRRVLVRTDLALHEVFEAGTGTEALNMLKARKVSLILADIEMPDMSGVQLLASVRSRPEWSRIPVLMITAEVSQANVLEAIQMGAQGYVRKPFPAEQALGENRLPS